MGGLSGYVAVTWEDEAIVRSGAYDWFELS
jgi:hypothetical protein